MVVIIFRLPAERRSTNRTSQTMEIQPNKQNLNETFSNKVYFIDFYQRDYKWTEEPVKRLLDDIFYQFDAAIIAPETMIEAFSSMPEF